MKVRMIWRGGQLDLIGKQKGLMSVVPVMVISKENSRQYILLKNLNSTWKQVTKNRFSVETVGFWGRREILKMMQINQECCSLGMILGRQLYIPSLAIRRIHWWEVLPKNWWMNWAYIYLITLEIVDERMWCGTRGCIRSFLKTWMPI